MEPGSSHPAVVVKLREGQEEPPVPAACSRVRRPGTEWPLVVFFDSTQDRDRTLLDWQRLGYEVLSVKTVPMQAGGPNPGDY